MHAISLQSISTVPPNEAIQIQYTPMTLRQGSKYVRIASIYYHGRGILILDFIMLRLI